MVVEKYYFLFGLALLYSIFAVVQDLKKEEIANWLNYSLICFAFIYRVFYALSFKDKMFLIYGLMGFALFFIFANLLYYSGVFGGGDAKLLMGFGVILPIESFYNVFFVGIGFLFLLFLVGAFYSLGYSLFIVGRNWKRFKKEFKGHWVGKKTLFGICFFVGLMFGFIGWQGFGFDVGMIVFGFIVLFPLLYFYLFSVEKCMIRLVSPDGLTEGDWLVSDIKLGKKCLIKKSASGLSYDDIIKLKKAGKSVWIKKGIPFSPAFLVALIVMVFFWEVLLSRLVGFLALLS
ncbi:MAG: A24 family peptidase [Candidatus Pacearchaeota archaeon]|nr:A24 family peptidase [Candidatus Pacearchaeota archaeon]